ncbi:MAG TPA: GDSL-type esterase/lipase family protein [Blastocatellia bacterium]|nr:GDSL-type esterase/lipase family protein [Blastocatellia bacterium]
MCLIQIADTPAAMTNEACNQLKGSRRPARVGRTIHCTFLVIAVLTLSVEARCDNLIKPQRIENPTGLQKFYELLHRSAQQSPDAFTRIIHYGDSHVAADWLTGKLRRNFHRDFGAEFVAYEAKGSNGARATKPLGWNWEAIAESFLDNQPALIVIAYGSNEVGDADLDLDEYKVQFETLLHHCKEAAPEASLLVLAPPDRAIMRQGHWRTISRLPALIATQREAALNEGAAFWNQFQAMGSANSINRWANLSPKLAQKDRVHLTRAGYELIADALYAELMREFENYQQRTTKE